MKKFSINNCCVDIDRCQVKNEKTTTDLEPKVAAVLMLLVEKQGQLVTHQEFFSRIWPKVVVDPNALQRCIAQLRKVLGDDAKQQAVIATQAKKGYCLVASVVPEISAQTHCQLETRQFETLQFETSQLEEQQTEILTPETFDRDTLQSARSDRVNVNTKIISLAQLLRTLVIAVVAILSVSVLASSLANYLTNDKGQLNVTHTNPSLFSFSQMTALTSTDVTEFYSVFSPDGRYLVFARQTTGPYNHFFVKDLLNNREIQLTKNANVLNEPTWSPNGEKLAYIAVECQDENCLTPLRQCMRVEIIDAKKALKAPQHPEIVMPCESRQLLSPQWLNNETLVYIDADQQPGTVYKHIIPEDKKSIYFQSLELNPYYLSYSELTQQLAITVKTVNQDLPKFSQVLVFDADEKIKTTITITDERKDWQPVWNNLGDGFIFSENSSLYHLTLNGQLSEQQLPTFENIFQPQFHPDGKSIAATLGHYDYDILETNWLNTQNNNLFRSTTLDGPALYQPGGEHFAFISRRSGYKQLWIKNEGGLTQLSQFTNNSLNNSFTWSPDGKQLALIADQTLLIMTSEGASESFNINDTITAVYQWMDNNTLLLGIQTLASDQLVEYNLNDHSTKLIYDGSISWAQKSTSGATFVLAENHTGKRKLYTLDNKELLLINELAELDHTLRFTLKGNTLFLLTIDKSLWSYSLSDKSIDFLYDYGETKIRFITDIDPKAKKALAFIRPWMKTEMVLLH